MRKCLVVIHILQILNDFRLACEYTNKILLKNEFKFYVLSMRRRLVGLKLWLNTYIHKMLKLLRIYAMANKILGLDHKNV